MIALPQGLKQLVRENIVSSMIQTNMSFLCHFAGPDAAPGNVVAVVESSTETKVSWVEVPAIDENGVITMYEIQFVPLETFGGQITSDTVNTSDGSVLMMVLTGLEEHVHYTISVRAYTSAGSGPYSIVVVERTDTDGKFIFVYMTYINVL